jgi:hypothetical protein
VNGTRLTFEFNFIERSGRRYPWRWYRAPYIGLVVEWSVS